jgi:hypothetical protein
MTSKSGCAFDAGIGLNDRLADQRRRVAPAVPRGGRIHVDVSPVAVDDLKAFLEAIQGDANGIVMDGRRLKVDRLCHRWWTPNTL